MEEKIQGRMVDNDFPVTICRHAKIEGSISL